MTQYETVNERIAALRVLMKEKKIDAYLVPTDDFHGSEYVGDYFKCREYITGFTGSAGTALIMQDMAGLWTDGRYFIQAAEQLKGSCITLFKMGEPGVPTVREFLESNMGEGMCLGFDGRTVSAGEAQQLQDIMGKKKARICVDLDLVGDIWTDRPAMSCEPVMELDIKWTGELRQEKCKRIRKKMKEHGADVFILTSLDDIAWLLNIRGGDIHCCPVVLSYLLMTEKEIYLYASEEAFQDEVKADLQKDGITFLPYDHIYESVKKLKEGSRVILCKEKVNSSLVSSISENVIILDEENLTLLPKAVKNKTEVDNERKAHIKDAVAVTKFIYWLKKNVGRIPITEMSAAEKLYSLRTQQDHFLGNSFDPIISYGPHAAIVHYSAAPETDIPIEPQGFLLADTGGHYLEGTTDITRTIVMGPVTEEQKIYYTAVLRGMLNLADARFLYGCTGLNLDYLARKPLWDMGADFKHGTGHGVGYLLNVHESPNSFRWKVLPGRENAVLEEGMITSDEPGYYKENEFGIRLENLILCKKGEQTSYGQFMCFEHLTMVPFDQEAIIPELMTQNERNLLNEYHKIVYKNISPYLEDEEKEWLKQAVREI